MSLQWTFVATFLYTEVFALILLLLPFVSAARWQKVFRSRIVLSISAYANIYFSVLIVVLLILFMDSVREVRKYSTTDQVESDAKSYLGTLDNIHMKLFRAQRNFYIAGFALFLWLVLKRMVVLISSEALLGAQKEAAIKQAESASAMARTYMEKEEERKNKDSKATEGEEEEGEEEEMSNLRNQLQDTKDKLNDTNDELRVMKNEFTAMKKQAESTNRAYDQLLEEHGKLQSQLPSEDSKKDA